MTDVGVDVFAEWGVVPEDVVALPYMYIYIYIYIYIYTPALDFVWILCCPR